MRARCVVLLVSGMLLTTGAGADEPLARHTGAPDWGTAAADSYTLHAFEFVPLDSGTTYGILGWTKFISGGYPALAAGVHLPTGALVLNLFAAVCDDAPAQDLQLVLWRCPSDPFTDPCVIITLISSAGLEGCDWIFNVGGPFPFTVDNGAFTYFAEFNSSAAASHLLDSARFAYQLQVSPPPATATFGDVPTGHVFFQYVEALAASGITAGCGGGDYCPDQPVTRGQMAVFLSKALGLHWTS